MERGKDGLAEVSTRFLNNDDEDDDDNDDDDAYAAGW